DDRERRTTLERDLRIVRVERRDARVWNDRQVGGVQLPAAAVRPRERQRVILFTDGLGALSVEQGDGAVIGAAVRRETDDDHIVGEAAEDLARVGLAADAV